MSIQHIPMRVSMEGTVYIARCHSWTPERLKQCFYDMPLNIAEALLDYDPVIKNYSADINDEGTVIFNK